MSADAIVTMVLTMTAVTISCSYFFIKVLRTPPKTEDQEE